MINWNMIKFTELGDVILKDDPQTLCTKAELKKRVANRSDQVGFWKELLDEWEEQGILN